MEFHEDFHRAIQALSDHLLTAHIERGPHARMTARTVASLLANVGHHAHAVGIGYKTVQGQQIDEPCIRVHVTL